MLAKAIVARLTPEVEELRARFQASPQGGVRTRHVAIDGLLPEEVAQEIARRFPSHDEMRALDTFRERKQTSKAFERFDPLMLEISMAVQEPEVLAVVEEITGILDQSGDPLFYAGGLSAMKPGDFLNPHIDNSHDDARERYRTLNLLYYITPGWQLDSGGHLELWDPEVQEAVVIPSAFNRLVLMATDPWSWHSVSEVKAEGQRRCVSNYYFSPRSPTGEDYFHVTSFSGRPEQPLRRVVCQVDNLLRNSLRKVLPGGLGGRDVYEQK